MRFASFSSLLLCLFAVAPPNGVNAQLSNDRASARGRWIDTWVSMPQLTEPGNLPPPPFTTSSSVFADSTIRQTVRMSIGGDQIRLRFSNAFGVNDLQISAVTVALPSNGAAGGSAIKLPTLKTLTFSGSPNFTIPNGALAVSDPVKFTIQPQSILTVTIYLANGQQGNAITSHPGSRTTSWISRGNHVSSEDIIDESTTSVAHWYFLSAVESWTSRSASSFVIVGDSITDGRGSETDKNNRWPDLLLARMQKSKATSQIAINNQAAGGNRILNDGLGPNALGRIDRDVLAHAGVKYVMLFEGVNDIGTTDTSAVSQAKIGDRLISSFQQIATRVHAFGIPIFAATITPFCAPANQSSIQPYSDPMREVTRQRINAWIRNSGVFDHVVDFDKVLADPAIPSQLNPVYDSGDFLHPNVKGYGALADAFPLTIFQQFTEGVDGY